MKNRLIGILLIFLSLFSFLAVRFLFTCNNPYCADPYCKDIMGSLSLMVLGVLIILVEQHKNKKEEIYRGFIHLSKDKTSQTIQNFSYHSANVSFKIPKDRNCS